MTLARPGLLSCGLLAALFVPATVLAQETPAATPSPAATPKPSAPATAKDRKRGVALIAKAVQAMGGASVVDSVRSLDIEGKAKRQMPNGTEMEVQTRTRILFPDRYRQDTVLAGGRMATLLGPQGGFVTVEDMVLPLPEEEMASLKKTLRRNLVALLQARRDPSYSAAFVGSGAVGGTPVERVRVEAAGEATTLAIDPKTGRILELTYTGPGPAGAPGAFVIRYSDYRPVDALSYPFSVNGTFEGKAAFASQLSSARINGPTEPAVFDPPPPSPEASPPAPPAEEKKPSPPPDGKE